MPRAPFRVTRWVVVPAIAGLAWWSASCSSDRPAPGAARSFDLDYRFTVRHLPAAAEQVTAWVPVPPVTPHQDVGEARVEGGWSRETRTEDRYGNRYLVLDLTGDGDGTDISVTVTFPITRRAYRALATGTPGEPLSSTLRARFLGPNELVPVDGRIAAEARRVAGGVDEPLRRARRLYDHIVESVSYDKSGQGWGRGDAAYACDVRAGNCTDFHALFIGEARALEVPARFIMGLPLPARRGGGVIPGYHCWAEFHVDAHGWVPIDASEAHKQPGKREALFGGLDENRVQLTCGRDIRLPGSRSGPVSYSVYAHVEVDGEVHPQVETTFAFRDTGS